MTTANLKIPRMTSEEYLAWEEKQLERHEYLDGVIRAMSGDSLADNMAGASLAHNRIVTNLLGETFGLLRKTGCVPYTCTQKVQSEKSRSYFYPDIVIVCGDPQLGQGDSILNPVAIFEVLSPSTERYDRFEKFRRYQTIETLQEYFLVSQDVAAVESFQRRGDGGWNVSHYIGLGASLPLESVGIVLPLTAIYDNIVIAEEEAGGDS